MAELATDLYMPELVDDNQHSGALIKTSSPMYEVLNGHTAVAVPLSKKDKKKLKKQKEKANERLLSIQSPPANGQETIFAEEPLAAEPVTAAEDQGLLIAVPEQVDFLETTLPEKDPVPEIESIHGPSADSSLPGHINGFFEKEISPPAPDPQELIYLPFSAQHKLMNVRDMEHRLQIISFVIEIRRCAVNRKPIDTTVLEGLLSSALDLAKVLEEHSSVDELEQLRESVIQTTHRLAEETQVMQARHETKLQKITAARARLDVMEERAKALLSKRLEKSRSAANGRIIMLIREAECSTPKVALPGGSTTRSCLDWMNDLESSLALGEDES
ncbi:uncharacterized protein FFFS_13319 [Fusarium fujikuroi]|nr:uncharacterized protein FFFS_13319 [Fusarium fujikuroi]